MDCDANPFNPWCFCFNNDGKSLPIYKQYDADNNSASRGIGNHCCHNIHYDPSFLAQQLPSQGIITTNISYLTKLQNNIQNDKCNYNIYLNEVSGDSDFNDKFPDLFTSTQTQRTLFNAFFNHQNSIHNGIISQNTELIPVFTSNNVTCPNSNYIPYYLAYSDQKYAEDKFIFICYPRNASFPELNLKYRTNYFYDNNKNNCKNNSCNTETTSPPVGYNAGHQAHENNKSKKLNSTEIIIISISAVFVFIGFIIGMVYLFKGIKRKNESVKNSNKNSNYARRYFN